MGLRERIGRLVRRREERGFVFWGDMCGVIFVYGVVFVRVF